MRDTSICNGCGVRFTAVPNPRRPGKRPGYCSLACATKCGPWSYSANRPTNDRALGVTRS